MKYRIIHVLFLIVMITTSLCAQTTGGIGAVLQLDTAAGGTTLPRIKSIVPNSPAAAKKLPEGAYILKVNDFECRNQSLENVVSYIRGEVGASVSLTLSDNPEGRKPKVYTLDRGTISIAPGNAAPADPTEAFNASCAQVATSLKRKGNSIVKTFTSECGDYYFSFEASDAQYKIKVLAMEATNTGAYAKGFTITASTFDSNNEAAAVQLTAADSTDNGNSKTWTLDGSIALKRNSVGVVTTKIHPLADGDKCKAMYIIVYQ